MLVNNKIKTVELIIDNLLWGNLILSENDTHWTFGRHETRDLRLNVLQWLSMREEKNESEEFKKITNKLLNSFIEFRFSFLLKGQMRNRDVEKDFEILKADNFRMAKELQAAYRPFQPKSNVGTA